MDCVENLRDDFEFLSEDALEELEACLITYDSQNEVNDVFGHQNDAAVSIVQRQCQAHGAVARLSLRLMPRNVTHLRDVFVSGTLSMDIGSGYPSEELPCVALNDVRGLDEHDVSVLLNILRKEASSMKGELILGHLIETALDVITDMNLPRGSCSLCLELLEESPSAVGSFDDEGLKDGRGPLRPSEGNTGTIRHMAVKLPCYHAFHGSCFTSWLLWQQEEHQRCADQLTKEFRAVALEKHKEYGLVREKITLWSQDCPEIDLWAVRCPNCRTFISPRSLHDALPRFICEQLGRTLGSRQGIDEDRDIVYEEGNSHATWVVDWTHCNGACPLKEAELTEESLQLVKKFQKQFETKLKLQRERGGLVDETFAIRVSDMQGALDAARRRSDGTSGSEIEQSHQAYSSSYTAEIHPGNKTRNHRSSRRRDRYIKNVKNTDTGPMRGPSKPCAIDPPHRN